MICLFAKYNNRIVQIPVNPQELNISGKANNESVDIVNGGQVTNIKFPKLKELRIQSFFPYRDAPYVNTSGSFEKPDFYITFFNSIKEARKPFRLIVTDLDINMLVSIEGFDYKFQYGTEDVDYTIELKEYREHNIKVMTANGDVINSVQQVITQASSANSDRSIEKQTVKTYTVIDGDNLWTIASRLLGAGSRWIDIYNYLNNKTIIGGNPNLIRPGQILSIPSR